MALVSLEALRAIKSGAVLSRDLQIAGIPLGRERGSSLPFTTARSSPFQLIRIYCNPRHSLDLVYCLFVWEMVFTRKIYLGISLTQPNFLSPANFLHFLWYECKLFVQFVLIIMFQQPPIKSFVQLPLNKSLSKGNSEANIITFWVWTRLMVLWDPPSTAKTTSLSGATLHVLVPSQKVQPPLASVYAGGRGISPICKTLNVTFFFSMCNITFTGRACLSIYLSGVSCWHICPTSFST